MHLRSFMFMTDGSRDIPRYVCTQKTSCTLLKIFVSKDNSSKEIKSIYEFKNKVACGCSVASVMPDSLRPYEL